MGLVMLLLLSGMSRIPAELFEAARLDGAGPVREFFAITLPSVRGEITVALVLTIIAALKTFEDRKSTRLNSSHVAISYAVFCLKKKKESGVAPGRGA